MSVGTQLPFDRLSRAVDQWAARQDRRDVVAQIGPSSFQPVAMRSFAFLEHDRLRELQLQCSLMVSHAGMGSIITAMELGKPIIIMARDHRRGEHRNGHQLATIKQFNHVPGVYVAADEAALEEYLDRADELSASTSLASTAPGEFIEKLAAYVHTASRPPLMRRVRRLFHRLSPRSSSR
ncbi:hypothetical protein BH10PSE14_BH10PSE14_31650 [soil metagenome]